jgi:hypothetical protein
MTSQPPIFPGFAALSPNSTRLYCGGVTGASL